ncbi:MAG: hypothetical protein MUE42_10405 [Opitutaceae bacterium]|nr:hypothetical protein [Opitutaceae bacterium]
MSSSLPVRPARAGRHHPLRLGSSVSCLFFTLLAANQAAARESPSLPYLKQGEPMALRLAAVRARTPPPPALEAVLLARAEAAAKAKAEAEAAELAARAEAASAAAAQAAEAGANALPGSPPGTTDPLATDATTPGGNPARPGASTPGGTRLVPDTYAPLAPPVRVEDLLPYFLPQGPADWRRPCA